MVESGVWLAIGSAAAWGGGDVAGGLAARRAGGLEVAGGAQLVGFVLLLALLLVIGAPTPATETLVLGALGGLFGGLGLAALYRGLSMGAMGLVSAVSGVGAVLIPLTVALLAWGTRISDWQLVGVACALAAVAAASGATAQGVSRLALGLALLAAIGFGGWFVLLDRAAAGNQLWALVAARGSATLLIGSLAVPRGEGPGLRRVGPLVAAAGVLDAGANALVVLAFASVGVGVAAALSGTYPLFTMLLARLLLGEALPRLGVAAVLLGVAGIVLISLG